MTCPVRDLLRDLSIRSTSAVLSFSVGGAISGLKRQIHSELFLASTIFFQQAPGAEFPASGDLCGHSFLFEPFVIPDKSAFSIPDRNYRNPFSSVIDLEEEFVFP